MKASNGRIVHVTDNDLKWSSRCYAGVIVEASPENADPENPDLADIWIFPCRGYPTGQLCENLPQRGSGQFARTWHEPERV